MDQTDNGGGSMHSHECEPSLGSTSTINQEAWAVGLSNDREQGTTRVAFMAFGAGVERDALGSYVPVLLAGVLCLAAAAAFGLVRRPLQAPALT